MEASHKPYLPAAGQPWLLPFYDPLMMLLGGEAALRALVEQASIESGQRVLDIGCGTGNLPLMIKRLRPEVDMIGIDPDPHALARAERKARRASVAVQFDEGFADALPYRAAWVDRALSSFMYHHLQADDRHRMLSEVRRVLKPGGIFLLLDFGGQECADSGLLARLIHASHHLKDNSEERILSALQGAGFADAKKVRQGTLLFGSLHIKYYRSVRA